ncbi:MAG: exonuclease domain-containing protein [Bacteroidales bacterium]|jgi:DNA polymerase-3 subunit epsilon
MKLNLNKPLAFFDLETTGLSITKDRIIEIAVLKINPDSTEEEKTWLINPGMPIPAQSTEIHKITDEDVKDKPLFKDVAAEINNFFGNSDLAGYNVIKFDIPFLVEEFTRAGIDFNVGNRKFLDVQNIFHAMEQRTLKAAYKFYCDKALEDAHEAMVDTRATYEVLLKQIERYDGVEYEDRYGNISYPIVNDIEKLSDFTYIQKNVDLAGFIVYNKAGEEVFSFGKHKNKSVKEVLKAEPQYYDWIMKSDFPEYTKRVLTKIYTDTKFSATLF